MAPFCNLSNDPRIYVSFDSEVEWLLVLITYAGVGQVVLQVAAATPCKCSFGIEKAYWPALYAKVTLHWFYLL